MVAGGADADPVREELLEVGQQGVEGQGCPSAFGLVRRIQVRKTWAAVARVAWWCQPVQLRPSKWSSPRPVSVGGSRVRSASGSSPAHHGGDLGFGGQVGDPVVAGTEPEHAAGHLRKRGRWVRFYRQAIRRGATAAAGTRRRLGQCHGWQAGSGRRGSGSASLRTCCPDCSCCPCARSVPCGPLARPPG